MNRRVLILFLLVIAYFPAFLFALPEDEITEEEVVKILEGEREKFFTAQPPGIAFGMLFSPLSERAAGEGKRSPDGQGLQPEEFYKKLIPLGRALESEALKEYRFALIIHADPPVPRDQASFLSLKVAEEVKHFLTTYFAIASERLVIQDHTPSFPTTEAVAESTRTPNWRVEITRLE